jgi:hypothetical protein
MFPKITTLLTAVLSVTLSVQAAPPAGSPQESVLLLRNGEVLCGAITKVGDRYVATLGNGSELRITVRDVEMHCLTLDEVYQRKRASIAVNSVSEHLTLADWCLCNALHRQAADELLKAIALDPDHPRLAWFERRLQSAIDQPSPSSDEPCVSTRAVSLEELERTMQGLPEDAVEAFVSRVQPLLLNRCGANTCHGVRSDSEFRLVRPGWGKTVTRRFTQRNLHATLSEVNTNAPHESPLLVAPSAPHGNVAGAIFGEQDEAQLRVLVDWVKQVTRDRQRKAVATLPAEPAGQLMQASYEEPVHLPQSGIDEPVPTTPTHDASLPPTSHGRPASPLVSPAPRDAFDPDVFNRRHHPAIDATGEPPRSGERK